jgi:hypothetical protein
MEGAFVAGGEDGVVLLRTENESLTPVAKFRAVPARDAGLTFAFDRSAVEFGGAQPEAARSYPGCRVGSTVYDFDLCAGRFELPGLTRAVLSGDVLDTLL